MRRRPCMVAALVLVALAVLHAPAVAASPRAAVQPLVCPEGGGPSDPVAGGTRSNDDLTANETFARAMDDVRRLRIVTGFCELRADTLTLDLGEGAFSSASAEYNLSRVYAAYRGMTEYAPETALELRYEDRVVGWHTAGGLVWIDKPAAPLPAPAPEPEARVDEATTPEDETRRTGLHFSAGAGAGSFDRQCRGCDLEADFGVVGFLSLGRWLGDKTVLGIEGSGWTREEFDRRTLVYSGMVQVTRYAGAASGLFLRAGAGLVGYRDDFDLTAMGPGFSARAGYDLPLGRVHLSPALGYVRSFDGLDLKRDGDEVGFNFVISELQFGVGISLH